MSEKSVLEQMRADIERALAKPLEQRRWAMIVDIEKCVGCHGCTAACKAENKTPHGVDYRFVKDAEDGEYPDVKHYFMPNLCMQCDKAPCVEACTDGSVTKGVDGVVRIDYAKNTGDPKVTAACPYGVMSTDEGDYYTKGTPKLEPYEDAATFEYGQEAGRKDKIGKNRKCHYCLHRIEAGMLPACVSTCIGEANYFGDLNDPESLVAKLAGKKGIYIFGADFGTDPITRYLGADEYHCAMCHE
ncbi:MAG: 4Fe-4S dicluster domain-containing protein [Deltaproteobacteria bacterium]|nr:4Fe-4S dicluster domain-containing protein [Deltaproteobacteria bacterium]